MALADLTAPVRPMLRPETVRLLGWTTLVWLVGVLVFSAVYWFDAAVLDGNEQPYARHLFAWTKGTIPWLVLIPVVYRLGARPDQRSPREIALFAAGSCALSMVIVGTYAALAWSIGTERTPLEVLAGFRLRDWMWDIVFYIAAFVSGLLVRPKLPVAKAEPEDIAVKSIDRVEYVPVREILGATAQGNYIALHLKDRDVLHRATMASLVDTLSDAGFVRTHRSHMIRPDSVKLASARGGRVREVVLQNGVKIPVSDRYNDTVHTRLSARVFG